MVSQQSTCCICLPKDQSVKKLSTKARVPTKGPERQEVINKGQSAYRRTRATRKYQQKPESKKDNGDYTRIGRPYTMVVPMNISNHREAGNLIVEINKQQEEGRTRPLIRTTRRCKKQTTRRHATKRLRHLMHDKH